MPGIVGVIGDKKAGELIVAMADTMRHEDFYSVETYMDEKFPAAFGLVSLNTKNQIVSNEEGSVIGLMDGEIFGYHDIREHLIRNRHRFKTDCDAEFLLHLYKDLSDKFLSGIRGWFTIAIYNRQNNELILANDKLGFKPLYYAQVNEMFIFASELKAIMRHPAVRKEVNLNAVAQLALFNFPLGKETFVKGTHRLPPAAIWSFKAGRLSQKSYWRVEALLSGEKISVKESLEQGGLTFRKIVNDLLKDETGIGLTLTAGYDSRAILSAIDCNEVSVHTFTFGPKTHQQALIAKEVAKVTGSQHVAQEFKEEFSSKALDFMNRSVYITDGLCNIIQSHLLYVFGKQRRFVNAYLTGIGGSEIIRGLQDLGLLVHPNSKEILVSTEPQKTFRSILQADRSMGFFSKDLCRDKPRESVEDSSIMKYSKYSFRERALFFALLGVFRRYYGAEVVLENSQVQIRLPYMDFDFMSFILKTPFSILHTESFSRNPFERLKGQRFSASVIRDNNPLLLSIKADRGYAPFWNISPIGYPVVLFHQVRRRLLRESLFGYEPYLIEAAKRVLEEERTINRHYYDGEKIRKALRHCPGWDAATWRELAKVVTFELWLRQFID